MGLLNELGEVAGALAAVEAAEKLDPNAGFLTKAAAAVAGFKGVGAVEGMVENRDEPTPADGGTQQADNPDSQA